MIKRIKQGAAALLLMCVMTVLLPWCGITAFAATARIAFSDPSAAAGSEFTVRMKITGSEPLSTADVMLSYDAASWNLSREPIRTAETELSGFMEMQDQAAPPHWPMS